MTLSMLAMGALNGLLITREDERADPLPGFFCNWRVTVEVIDDPEEENETND